MTFLGLSKRIRVWREFGMWRFRFGTPGGGFSTHRGDFRVALREARHMRDHLWGTR